jgi:hypothetical protein
VKFHNKLAAVKFVLSTRPDLQDWYAPMITTPMTLESVYAYGTGQHGDIADYILQDSGLGSDCYEQ